jgi:hypothetical protein
MLLLLLGCFQMEVGALSGDPVRGKSHVIAGCDCHHLDLLDSDGNLVKRQIGERAVVDHRGLSVTWVERVLELGDAEILAVVHNGAFLMPPVVDDPQEAADILAFLRADFGEP